MIEKLFIFNESNYMFAIVVLVPLAVLFLYKYGLKRKLGGTAFVLAFLVSFALFIGSGYISKERDEYNVAQYDVNHDGVFSSEEESAPGFEKAEDILYDDAWFSMLPITSLVFALLIAGFEFLIVKFFNLKRK